MCRIQRHDPRSRSRAVPSARPRENGCCSAVRASRAGSLLAGLESLTNGLRGCNEHYKGTSGGSWLGVSAEASLLQEQTERGGGTPQRGTPRLGTGKWGGAPTVATVDAGTLELVACS